MLMYITSITVNSTEEFNLFALFHTVPSRDETFVSCIGGGRVARHKVTVIQVPERVCQIRCGGVTDVRQYGLQKRTIIVEFGRLGYCQAVQSDATLTEERMQKVIHHSREIRVIQSRPIRLGQLTTNVELYMQIYVNVIIGGDKKL